MERGRDSVRLRRFARLVPRRNLWLLCKSRLKRVAGEVKGKIVCSRGSRDVLRRVQG